MAFLEVKNVRIAGISAAVPKKVISNVSEKYGGIADDFVNTTGVIEKREDPEITTADLCESAATKLLEKLHWGKSEIDALFFVSQTADYIMPATSCILQNKLGLSKNCASLDINLGCSGWVYGMSALTSFMQSGFIRKAILCAGDVNMFMQKDDRLSGEAGTVTALEFDESASHLYFNLGTDGSGAKAIFIPHGGARHYFDKDSLYEEEIEGKLYPMTKSRMKGMDVFSFGISTAPKAVKQLATHFNFNYLDNDYFVFHQANLMMNKIIDKKLKLPEDKVLYSLSKFGNTSSASIPLTIISSLPQERFNKPMSVLACGFGVGLSWGAVKFKTNDLVVPSIIEL